MKNIKIISLSLLVAAAGTAYGTVEYGTTCMWLQEEAIRPQQKETGSRAETIRPQQKAIRTQVEAGVRPRPQQETLAQLLQAQHEQQEQAQRAAAEAWKADAKTQDSAGWSQEAPYEILN